MFARPPKVEPSPRKQDVDHTFTRIAKPLIDSVEFAKKEDDQRSAEGTQRTHSSVASNRTGDSLSYNYNTHDSTFIPERCSRRLYRVVSFKENSSGKRIMFDPIDGRIFSCDAGYTNRTSNNVVLFDSKRSALSERYPSNQIGGSTGGNGIYPRMLVAFGTHTINSIILISIYRVFVIDCWGNIRRRHGGGPSMHCEYAKFMSIVEFLDPPHPVPKRLSTKYVEPFFFTPADKTPPNRLRAKPYFKVHRFFTLRTNDHERILSKI